MGKVIEVRLPDLGDGESQSFEAVVSHWPVRVGTLLHEGDDLLEIVTDKASFVVPSPVSGVLVEQCVQEEDCIRSNDLIAKIDLLE